MSTPAPQRAGVERPKVIPRKRALKDKIESAAAALSDLNIFYGVIALLEGGTIHSPSYRAQERIIRICKDEGQRRIADYDRHVARAAQRSGRRG